MMKVQTNQTSKDDKRIGRLVVVAETEEDRELLSDLVDYLKYRESELTSEG